MGDNLNRVVYAIPLLQVFYWLFYAKKNASNALRLIFFLDPKRKTRHVNFKTQQIIFS